MYMIDDMVDLGLREGQSWPSDAHRTVAQVLFLYNSRVTTREAMIEGCQAVMAVPKSRIKKATAQELASEYQVPYINLS